MRSWLRGYTRTWYILAAFRIFALLPALGELVFGYEEYTGGIPRVVPAIVATLYTFFKLAHPVSWYRSKPTNIALFAVDIAVCESLLLIPGQIHIPFSLYSLAPVVTSAVLLSHRTTMVMAGSVAIYYSLVYFTFPSPLPVEHLSSVYATYLVALGFAITLPYAINTFTARELQFKSKLQERRRVGREIHDGLCQTIYALQWQLQLLRKETANYDERLTNKMKQLERLVAEAETEARGSLESLRDFQEDRPFLLQIREYLERFESDTGIGFRLEAEDAEPGIEGLVKLEALYICEEALRNVAKHSGARHVAVTVRSRNSHVRIGISDDGCGLNGSRSGAGRGLTMMKERAESVGGSLKVTSLPGKGVEIHLEVPRQCPMALATELR